MKYYRYSVNEVLRKLNTSELGLNDKEALERLKKYGKNKIKEVNRESNIEKFFNQFADIMIIILIASSIASFVLADLNNEPYIDSIAIIAIVILNSIMGFIQELKADKAIEQLKKLQTTKVKVKRNNKIIVINSEDIVVGDILVLEAGDKVPADARIIWGLQLKVDESSLTGESNPVEKDTLIIEEDVSLSLRKNMIYSGTNIIYGKCIAVVCEVGMNSELGLIAKSLLNRENKKTLLQQKIDNISKILSIVIEIIIIIMFIIGIIKGISLNRIIMLSISLSVAAIPEGLPAVITIILSLSMKELTKKNVIIRNMSSVETLGNTEIICSDKTGTITQNKMKVREVYYGNEFINVNEIKNDNLLLKIMALNNDVEKNNNEYIGEPTEIALYECCEKFIDINKIRNNNKRIDEISFDSNRKMMSTINSNDNEIIMYTKGSFDAVIEKCSYIYVNGKVNKLTKEKIKKLKNIEEAEANKAYRVLAYAYKDLSRNYKINNNIESNLVFVGISSLSDLPRKDVKDAISLCKSAHIKPIMITGDSMQTALAIAKEVGICNSNNEAILGIDLDNMSEEKLVENVNKYSVYARVSPINKLSIVNALKQNNKVVAMTGDGVNDAPALKYADIGIGMGITGTEVAKSVSDVILTDDSFSSIVTAVKEGRRIYDNIRNVLVYLLSSNIAEILIVFIGMLFGIEIFTPLQLLYINLITDSIPAIALTFEDGSKDIMKRSVRKKENSFFTSFLYAKIVISSIFKTITIISIYFINVKLYNMEFAMTISFLTLILLEIIYAYSCRNLKEKIINKNIFANKQLNISIILLIIIQVIVFISPLKEILNLTTLSIYQFVLCFFVVIVVFLIEEFMKKYIVKLFKD